MSKSIYYGEETRKAIDNFPISGLKPHWEYVRSVVLIKKAAAIVNFRLHLLDKSKSEAIIRVCDEILAGKLTDQYVIDPYQAGAGTSHNMNVNEVVANRASEISGLNIHPNDDVNMSQSTNDVIPAAIRISSLISLPKLLNSLRSLNNILERKSRNFSGIIKSGRTHLQDALPVTLGQEFSSYAKAVENDIARIEKSAKNLLKIGIGGTAVGTGINTHPEYHRLMISELPKLTGLKLKSSGNLLESANNTADFLDLSGSLKILATTLIRIGNDLRLLSSGPNAGFAEITLPEIQAGSSIMPGKVNPSIVEMVTMVSFQVIGFDTANMLAAANGQLELNIMLPLIADNLLEQIKLLTNALAVFNTKCVSGIRANEEKCRYWYEKSSGIAAILNPILGYDKVTGLVKESLNRKVTIKELVSQKHLLSDSRIKSIFSVENLTKPNLPFKRYRISTKRPLRK